MNVSKRILPVIVISQFCCTSLWFASNGVMSELILNFNLNVSALGYLTSAVQFGFIIGTLVFAILMIADRFSPSKVFLWSALLGALFNLGLIMNGHGLLSIILLRFFTGFFLAGIYPVGMKIAADYFQNGLGKSLGFIVGALVIGTASPHLIRKLTVSFPWQYTIILTSSLAVSGGLLMVILVPDGPYQKTIKQFRLSLFFNIFKSKSFRAAAYGYFGHMWELYAFWTFVPIILKTYMNMHPDTVFNMPLWSFVIIGIGGPACVIGGYFSQSFGNDKTARLALTLSCICCIISPFLFSIESEGLFIAFLIFWGMMVIADSPLFSSLIAQNVAPELRGTGLTIVNSIGFLITIISIQLLSFLIEVINPTLIYTFLAIGPIMSLLSTYIKRITN